MDLGGNLYATPTEHAKDGISTRTKYLVYDNNDLILLAGYNKYGSNGQEGLTWGFDIYDLNNNGRTDDVLPMSTFDFNVMTSIGNAGYKYIGNSPDNLSAMADKSFEFGKIFYYGLEVRNNQPNVEIDSVSILDILPYDGDYAIMPSQNNIYYKRGSKFKVEINGPVKLQMSDKSLVNPKDKGGGLYSTDIPSGSSVDALAKNLGKNFIKEDEVDDFRKVTMFKITRIPEAPIEYQSYMFVVPAIIPLNTEAEKGNLILKSKHGVFAYNAFVYASSVLKNHSFNPNEYVDVMRTGTTIKSFNISGCIFNDYISL